HRAPSLAPPGRDPCAGRRRRQRGDDRERPEGGRRSRRRRERGVLARRSGRAVRAARGARGRAGERLTSPRAMSGAAEGARLELRRPEGAFRAIEQFLRSEGFFAPGGEMLEADLYLGYGLSQTIRRRSTSLPPEPCALPFAACAVRGGLAGEDVRSERRL